MILPGDQYEHCNCNSNTCQYAFEEKTSTQTKTQNGKIIPFTHFKLSKSMQPPAIGEKRTLANINCLSRFKYACNFYALIKNIP